MPSKVWTVAAREYRSAVRTRAFLISLVMMPVLMAASAVIQVVVRKASATETKKYAVIDRTPGGKVAPALAAMSEARTKRDIVDPETGKQTRPAFELVRIEPSAGDREAVLRQRYELSERVKKEEFFGVLDVGPLVLQPATPDERRGDDGRQFVYLSDKLTDIEFPRWAEAAANSVVIALRFADRGVPAATVAESMRFVPMDSKGLVKLDTATGAVVAPSTESRVINFVVPLVLIAVMFVLILVAATPAMQGVVDEKQQRIAEVLLGSVPPFRLMLGKLLGMVGVSLTMGAVYLAGGYAVAKRYGVTDAMPPELFAWFGAYLVLAVLMYGSLFLAVGSAAADVKETQTLLMPIYILVCLPMFLLGPVAENPNGGLAQAGSFFPFSAPMLMIVRVWSPTGVAWWQPAVSMALMLLTTAACVWLAGRVFRVGLLSQGTGASYRDMARWALKG